jgi:phosphoadenosine phosphosulfate reductase
MVEFCNRGIKRQFVSPIIDWSDAEVWEYISSRQMPYCHLYDEGFKRIGCVGCPMSDQKRGFDRWPKFRDAYKRAIVRGYDAAVKRGIVGRMYSNGDELFDWWVAQQRNVDHDTLPLQFDQECEEDEDQEMMLE